ncbi:class F sortase [Amycolatopsis sp. WGS_07]|uniref:class F sortase n=1 Tax=Amycolatopsis sp. WGS_07 TaxID=3076764 RepID=UPI003872CE95
MSAVENVPTVSRIQTQLALGGLSWALLADTFLPGNANHAIAVASLVIVGAVGWEPLHHTGQRLRRKKNWQVLSGLLAAAVLACLVLRALGTAGVSPLRYLVYFSSAWLLIWLIIREATRVPRQHYQSTRPALAPYRRVAITAVAAAAALGLVLVLTTDPAPSPGMAHDAPASRSAPPPRQPVVAVNNPAVRVIPTAVHIPKLDANSSLIKLGLDANQHMQTPPVATPMQAGWYEPGPAPGQTGPAVIVGHIDGASQPGIFYRLRELAPGDRITVERADSSVVTFVVRQIIHAPKDRFPTREVYGRTPGPELRLITCGGSFDRTVRSYRDNVIVFAQLEGGQQP